MKRFIFTLFFWIGFAVQASDIDVESVYSELDYSSDSSMHNISTNGFQSSLAASYNLTTSSVLKPVITAEELRMSRMRQIVAVSQEADRKKIGNVATVHTQLHQMFTQEGHVHQGISLSEFAHNFPEVVHGAIAQSAENQTLSPITTSDIYEKMEYVHKRNLIVFGQKYKIVGNYPEDRESLYDLDAARSMTLSTVQKYIDRNLVSVRKNCLQKGLTEGEISKAVIELCTCKIQMHKTCARDCFNNNVNHCVNPYHTHETFWTSRFYKKALKKAKPLDQEKIKEDNCLVCYGPLRSNICSVIASANLDTETVSNSSTINLPLKKRLKASIE